MTKSAYPGLVTARPEKPIRYGLFARVADRRAGRVDGGAAVLAAASGRGSAACVTPYLAALDQRCRTQAELVRLRTDFDIAPLVERRVAVRQQIASAEADGAESRKRLEELPESAPADTLSQRNALERAADPELIRIRNQREWDARRRALLAEDRRAVDAVGALRAEEAQLAGAITTRERIGATRVRRLHEHALRRARTYERQLLLHHPDGATLLPQLELGRPTAPDWVRLNSRLDQDGPVAL